MLDCSHDCLIDASGEFDHYPTERDLAILGVATGTARILPVVRAEASPHPPNPGRLRSLTS